MVHASRARRGATHPQFPESDKHPAGLRRHAISPAWGFLSSLSCERIAASRDRARLTAEVHDAIGRALSAPEPDQAIVQRLAHRERLSVAVTALERIVRPDAPVDLRWSTCAFILRECAGNGYLAPRRLAAHLGLIPSNVERQPRDFDLSKYRCETADVIRALLGDCDWSTAARRVRAGFLLSRIVS